jgi:hypothetical protein
MGLEERYLVCKEKLAERHQEHVLFWWDEMDDSARDRFLTEIEAINWEVVDPLVRSHVLAKSGRR